MTDAPDRIWVPGPYFATIEIPAGVPYLRATPALLALVEAAEVWARDYRKLTRGAIRDSALGHAALTYARERNPK